MSFGVSQLISQASFSKLLRLNDRSDIYEFVNLLFISSTSSLEASSKRLFFLLGFLLSWVFSDGHEGSNRAIFAENMGQWHPNVIFKAELGTTALFLEKGAFHYQVREWPHQHDESGKHSESEVTKGHNFKARFIGSSADVQFEKDGPSFAHYNYFIGMDKSRWRSHVRKYESVRYQDLYPGIDLEVYSEADQVKYDFRLAVGADPEAIKIFYDGVDKVQIKRNRAYISHSLGQLVEMEPYAYQRIDGEEVEVRCAFKMDEKQQIGFILPDGYDSNYELIIDPILIFSTYSGSGVSNFGMTATYDRLGNAYTAGTVFGTGYDTTLGAFQLSFQGGNVDMAVSKFSPDGSQLLYGTYLGGARNEASHSLVVDDSLNLFLLGITSSSDYPVTPTAYDTTKAISGTFTNGLRYTYTTGTDIVVTKFSPNGDSLLGSTFYGGDAADGLNYRGVSGTSSNVDLIFNYGDESRGEIVLDSLGNCYVGTSTWSSNISGTINNSSGSQDGLVIKFDSDLTNVAWARYVGGANKDAIYSIKLNSNNEVVVGGGTLSYTDFPISNNAFQQTATGGRSDGFISVISADGNTVLNSTFVGTVNYDQVYFVEVDKSDDIYAFGQSLGGSFPVSNAKYSNAGASQFIIKLSNDLSNRIYSTVFGDAGLNNQINISPTAFLVDRCENVYISGWGGSIVGGAEGTKILTSNMPLSTDAFQSTTDNQDFYIAVFKRDMDALLYGSYFGGNITSDHVDGGTSRFDKNGIIYQSVCASCNTPAVSDFPTTNGSYAPTKVMTNPGNNNCNNAVFKYDFEILPVAQIQASQLRGCAPFTVNIKDISLRAPEVSWNFYGTIIDSKGLDTNITFTQAGTYVIRQFAADSICNSSDLAQVTIEVFQDVSLSTSADTIVCTDDAIQLGAFTSSTASVFQWSNQVNFSDTINNNLGDSLLSVIPQAGLKTYYVRAQNASKACALVDSIIIDYRPLVSNISFSEDTVCAPYTLQIGSIMQNADTFRWDLGNGQIDTTSINPTVTYTSAGTYTIELITRNKTCQIADTISKQIVVVNNDLQLTTIPDSVYCGTDSLELFASSSGSSQQYQWSSDATFTDFLNDSAIDSIIKVKDVGINTYHIRINDRFCSRIDEVTVNYNLYDIDFSLPIDTGCSPLSFNINGTLVGATSFEWNFGNGTTNTTQDNPSVTYPDSGLFSVRLISNNNVCNISDTLFEDVLVFPGVQVEPLSTVNLCLGDSITLVGNSFGSGRSFSWADNANFVNPLNLNPSDSTLFLIPSAGNSTYYFMAENRICSDQTSVQLNVQDVELVIEGTDRICIEDTTNFSGRSLNGLSLSSYRWEPADSIIGSNTNASMQTAPKNDVQFTLYVVSENGCKDTATTDLTVHEPLYLSVPVSASPDTIFKGGSTTLSTNLSDPNLTFNWNPNIALSNPNASTTQASPEVTTDYNVIVFNDSTGCSIEAALRVVVYEINCGEPDIFVPTAFTPNGDKNNDVLLVRGPSISDLFFTVYNRWGEKVFETKDQKIGWDGIFKGMEVDPGVFVYYLNVRCLDGQEYFKKGNITVIR